MDITTGRRLKSIALTLAVTAIGFGQNAATSRTANLTPASLPYIDAHTHIYQLDPEGAVTLILSAMERLNGAKAFIQTEPYGPDNPARWDALLEQGVVGFGELSIEHLSLPQSPVKDYEYAPADSPMMLLLADIAAEHNVPIDLHMEALPETIPTPKEYGPPNPPELHGNIAAFERLLAHNRRAKIIWAHAGSDNIGYRTPELSRRLLQAHPNLYMEIKFDPGFPGKDPPIVDGKLKPEWLKLYSDFPDRFIIGSDQHFDPPATAPLARAQQNALLLNQLPPDVRKRIAMENALRIYGR